ncbi:MAG: adenylyl-sulfate kinase [Thermoplasmatales archaeon]|jgi:adenylylsulfate kinase|nr:adenylyl-sulfate kinase [Candidatus Thermoplasmatota archaeon]MCL6002767.1 adenylyl-sulfate kinase [Candidatus Thermoplasmatota archaeon]MDA8056158.1 adenylyl-sulfate kinase [Thermoplasmatales archaeon]
MSNRQGYVLWFTGPPGAGKTTLAESLKTLLISAGRQVEILDGDEIRKGLSRDLGFSKEDREKHNERVIFVAKLLSRNGVVTLVPLISPYREVRLKARNEISNFIEIYVKCPLDILIKRDPKGLYKKALAGEITNLTGLQDPYEEPLSPEISIDTNEKTIEESVDTILEYLKTRGFYNS